MASLFVDVEHRRDPKGPQVRDFKSLNPAKNVSLPIPLQVGAYSDESLAMIVRVLTGSGAVATANVEARSGEDVVVVKNSLGEMSIESHFLPDKGYAQSFLAFSKGGTTTTVEEYFDFFDCGNGIWLPLRGSRDGYGVDGAGRRVLERRYEFFAIGKPDAGCEFAPDTFDVLSSERFKAAKSLPNTTNPVPVVPKVGTSRVWRWDWIFGVFLGLVLLSLSLLRRRFSRRQ